MKLYSKVLWIVVAYNPKTESFFALLKNLPILSTIIIDNGGTVRQEDVGKTTLLSQAKNIGYAGGANTGMRHALAHGAEWMVILNQDIVMSKKAVNDLSEFLSESDPGVYGPYGGGLDKNRWTTKLPSMKVDYISGSCIAIHKDVIQKIGYFYEPYFLYYEEVDYCIRAKNAGFGVRLALVEGIAHEESVSLGKGSPVHEYYLARNHLLFVSRLAPRAVKKREYVRIPLTISDHIIRKEYGALAGVFDFLFRRFGPRRGKT